MYSRGLLKGSTKGVGVALTRSSNVRAGCVTGCSPELQSLVRHDDVSFVGTDKQTLVDVTERHVSYSRVLPGDYKWLSKPHWLMEKYIIFN